MIKYLATKAIEKEAERKWEDNKKIIMYTGITVLAGIGAYFSYKAMKNYIFDREIEDDLDYLEYLENDLNEEPSSEYKEEDEQLKEKIDEFNSRRINPENDEMVSPKELTHYIDQIKVDKDEVDINEDDLKEDKYDEYEE